MTQATLSTFKGLLKEYCTGKNIQMRRWAIGNSPNIIEIGTSPRRTLLYIKNSNLMRRGFWGLHPKQMDALTSSKANWFIIFLKGTTNNGYILSARDVQDFVQRGSWYVSKEGDYKVHEQYLDRKTRFSTFVSLLERISKQD